MKKMLVTVLSFILTMGIGLANTKFYDDHTETQVDKLLAKMSLEEKVGQMTQLTLEAVSHPREEGAFENHLDLEKLRRAIVEHHVGSILNCGGAANTLENWHEIIQAIQDMALNETRLGIPVIYGIDAIHGANYTKDATMFPQSIAMAATRNPELVKQEGMVTALEMRASGIPWNFNPVLGLGREPLWPRFWETYGEDVYLTTVMGQAYIEGQQGPGMNNKDRVGTCMKHYIGYSVPNNGLDRTPAWIPENVMREVLLPPFEAAVKAGSPTVMVNSSEINGIPSHCNYQILTEILKEELGFQGFIVSDWEDVKRLHDRDRVAESPKEAVKMAVLAGLDMSMVPHDFTFYNLLLELAKDGEVPQSRIDDAVRRILRVKFALGLMNKPYPDPTLKEKFAGNAAAELNLKAAREAITLLKNDNQLLPLRKEQTIFVTGPTANLMSALNGGWSFTWQGDQEEMYPPEALTVMEAIQDKIGGNKVRFEPGITFEEEIDVEKAIEEAKHSDAIVLCLGERAYCESPGNIQNLILDEIQLDYAKRLYATGKPVILVLIEGRPRVIHSIIDPAQAILMAYLPGMEGGRAIADVLFGDVNPSGKLPFSYPAHPNGFTTYDHKPIESFDVNGYHPDFPFGHGLSYTSFGYENLKLEKERLQRGQNIKVAVKVSNTGNREGQEVVELYLCDVYGSVSRPVKQLKRFKKIALKPGESREITFTLGEDDFSFIGQDNKRRTEAGEFKVMIAEMEQSFTLE